MTSDNQNVNQHNICCHEVSTIPENAWKFITNSIILFMNFGAECKEDVKIGREDLKTHLAHPHVMKRERYQFHRHYI